MVELTRLFEGELDHALGARGEDHLLLYGLSAAANDRLDLLADFCQIDAERLEHFGRQALAFGNDPEQNVLGPDIVISETLRLFLSEYDTPPRSLGEGLPHRHRSGLPFLSINSTRPRAVSCPTVHARFRRRFAVRDA